MNSLKVFLIKKFMDLKFPKHVYIFSLGFFSSMAIFGVIDWNFFQTGSGIFFDVVTFYIGKNYFSKKIR